MNDSEREAIRKSGGNLTVIAQRLGVTREEVAARVAADENFRAAVDAEREAMLDMCEARLLKAANAGDLKAAARILRLHQRAERRETPKGYIYIFREIAAKRLHLPAAPKAKKGKK